MDTVKEFVSFLTEQGHEWARIIVGILVLVLLVFNFVLKWIPLLAILLGLVIFCQPVRKAVIMVLTVLNSKEHINPIP